MKQIKEITKTNRVLYLLFGFITILILTGGYAYYKHENSKYRSDAYQKLKTIADLKIKQVEEWRKERLSDINMLANSPFLQEKISSFLSIKNNESLKKEILKRFELEIKNETDYKNIIITGTDDSIKLAYEPVISKIDSTTQILIDRAHRTKEIQFGSLYKENLTGKIFIDIAAPVFNDKKEITAVIIYQLTPEKSLYPLIETWPVPSKSAETILFTKEGKNVLYLTTLKDRPRLRGETNSALSVRVPLEQKDNPAVQAVSGKRGFFEGTDYRKINVLEYIQPIAGSDWFLAAKIDSDELLSQVYFRTRVITAFALALFLLTGVVVLYFVHRNRQLFYKELYHEELELKALKAHFEYVVKFANDIILLEDEELNIVEANERASQSYLYSIDELKNLNMKDLIAPEERENIKPRLLWISEEGGLVVESVHQRKDGTTFFVEVSARTIMIEGKKFYHQIIRDITERKKAIEALRESEERFRTTLYSTGDAVITTDTNGQILNMNKVAEALTGWKEFDALGKKIKEIFPVVDEITKKEIENPVEKVLASSKIVFLANHTILKSKDGREIPIGDSGAPIRNSRGETTGVVLVFRDQSKERAAKKALEESEKKYRLLFESNPQPMWVYDLETLNFLTVNEAAVAKYGYSKEEFFSMKLTNIRPKEDETILMKHISEHHESLQQSGEWRHKLKDGSIIFAEVLSHSIEFNEKQARLVLAKDITKRKRAEDALRESEEKYRRLVENLGKEYYFYQHDTNGVFTYVSPSIKDMLGYSEEEYLNHHTKYETENPINKEAEKHTQLSIEGIQQASYEVEVYHKDGSIRWLEVTETPLCDDSGNVYSVEGIAKDITERKRIEEELIQSKDRMQVLVEGTPHLFFYVQDVNADIQYISPSVQEITGYSVKQWIGQNQWFITESTINKIAKERTHKNLNGEINLKPILVEVKHADGYPILLEVYEKPISRNNKVIGLQGVAHDITERKRAEDEIIKAKEIAESANKVKDAFISNISHEIRTPLNGIMGMTSIIKESYSSYIAEEDKELFSGIDLSGKRIIRTVEMILNYSRLEAGEFPLTPKKMVLSQICKNLVREFQILAEYKSIELSFENRSNGDTITADEYTVEQTISHLIDNAIKYTNKGYVKLTLYKGNNDGINLDVKDSGIGINKENLENIFEPYMQEHMGFGRAYEGIGLGLSLTRKYLDLNNAGISVESKKGEGTTFTIKFKAAK